MLSGFAALLILGNLLHWAYPPRFAFALYGMLHAVAVVSSLRESASLSRKLAFVLIAAVLSVITLFMGLAGRPLAAGLVGERGLYVVLALSSMVGAITYGTAIRLFWISRLTFRGLVINSVFCSLATLLAFVMLTHTSILGQWWLVVTWWFALSGGLCLNERPQLNTPAV